MYMCALHDLVPPTVGPTHTGNFGGEFIWRIGGFESNPPIFHPPKCDVIIIAKS